MRHAPSSKTASAGSVISAAASVCACLIITVKPTSTVCPAAQSNGMRSTVGSSSSCEQETLRPSTVTPDTDTLAPASPFM